MEWGWNGDGTGMERGMELEAMANARAYVSVRVYVRVYVRVCVCVFIRAEIVCEWRSICANAAHRSPSSALHIIVDGSHCGKNSTCATQKDHVTSLYGK